MEPDLIATPVDRAACPKCGQAADVQGQAAFSKTQCASCGTAFSVPVMLGSFLLVERMGAGGMGAVYRALDTALNRFVAVKVMKAALGEDAALVEGFLREARAAAALNHRNIVQIYSCGQENGQPYIVMELVTGGRMSGMFTRERPMDEMKLLKTAFDVAEGLQAANQAGLVHGDIKPENILIDKQGTAKIVDFGLAQFVNAQKERGEIWGTPYYISPERARGNKADHRSDIYSLGATMFHALAGEPPFEGETPADVVLARLKHPPPNLAQLRPDLQQETVDLIERMMAADPSLRYPNPASLKSDINAALHAAKNAAGSGKAAKRTISPVHLVIAAVAAVVFALAAVWLAKGLKQPESAQGASAGKAAPHVVAPPAATPLFTEAQAEELIRIAGSVSLGNLQAPVTNFTSYITDYKKRSPGGGYYWARLYRLVPLWIGGQELNVAQSLANDFKPVKSDTAEERIPKALAGWLNNTDSFEAVTSLTRESGYSVAEIAAFLEAAKLVSQRDWNPARKKIREYLSATKRKPGWLYAYDPLASELDAAITAHLEAAMTLDGMLANRNVGEARRKLLNYAGGAPSIFTNDLAAYAGKIKDVEDALEAERKEFEATSYRLRVEQDLKKLEGILAEIIPPMLLSNSFSVASVLITSRCTGLDTDEGRAAAQVAREQVDALEGLKKFLYTATEIAPFTRRDGFRLGGGDLTKASLQGLRTSAGGRTQTVYNWYEVPPEIIAQAVDFYSRMESISATDRADALVSLAMFSVMHKKPEVALNFARRAIELNPETRPKVQRLMPDLVLE